jgi:CHAT domain-containing protein/Tfp pilus assembly protein PilF
VIIELRGADIVVRLFAADGQVIGRNDLESVAQRSHKVELVAATAGNYLLEVEPGLPKADVGTYSIQLSEVREATADEKLLHEARQQSYEALRLAEDGRTDQAVELANRALAIREKVLGSEHRDVAASLHTLGRLYTNKGDLTTAEVFLQRAAEATAKISGAESLEYAEVLHNLAYIQFRRGNHAQAEQLNQRSLSIREKVAGPDSLPVANSLNNLGLIYRATNDLPRAEQAQLRALAIREKLLGPDHEDLSNSFTNLGLLYYGAGDFDSAEPMLQRALTISEKALGPDHRLVGRALNNLGLVESRKKAYEKAESHYQRALIIFENTTGPESDGVASILHNLGVIYKEAGQDLAKAENYYLRALAIWEKILGEYNPATGNAVHSLGILYQDMGDYERAEKFYFRALAIRERVQGPNNDYTVGLLRNLVQFYAAKGDPARAIEYQKRIRAIEEKIIPLNLTLGSERQKLAYFTQLQKPDKVISLHVGLARDNAEARDLAAGTVLERKGRVLDALSENLSALRKRWNAQDQTLLDNLSDLNSRLALLVLNNPRKMSPEEHQKQIKALEDQREKLEAEISRRSAGSYQRSQPVTLSIIRSAIPDNAVLIEMAVYHSSDPKAKGAQAYGEPRYVAYVLRKQGEVQWKELGDAKAIDAAIEAWREALRDPKRNDVQQLARAVDEKVMQPLRPLLGDATHLLISPDGALNLIPFEALLDEQNHYLVERFACTYLTSGRDLLRLQVARESKSPPLVLADPLFGEPELATVAKPNTPPAPSADRKHPGGTKRQSVTTGSVLSSVYFAPLSGTAREAQSIKSLFAEAVVLTGTQATESSLKQVSAPRIMHIATHGFFLSDAPNSPTSASGQKTRSLSVNLRIENPLLRSGLALAGANLRQGGDDDGILTAMEASGLNLWGTKLVTLSACDTGVGEVKVGEGVYGLRRALVLAGAETLVMSLWPVSDYVTRELMSAYYKGLKQHLGRGEALRQVQLSMLKHKGREHPFYWASFIQSGEWADLDGKR